MRLKIIASLLCFVALGFSLAEISWSTSSGPPPGFSGSPLDNKSCGLGGGCHLTPSIEQGGMITSNIPASGYIPDSVYSITVQVAEAGRQKFGFQASVLNTLEDHAGGLVAGSESQLVGNGDFITHDATGNSGQGMKSWSFNWQAPSSQSDAVTFYAAFNAANGNNATNGDIIYTSFQEFRQDSATLDSLTISTRSFVDQPSFRFFPNPTRGQIQLEFPENNFGKQNRLIIRNMLGSIVWDQSISASNESVDLSTLASGTYLLEVHSNRQPLLHEKLILR